MKEYKAKGHIKNLSGQVQSDPNWNKLVTNTPTGTVNILLSIGGTLKEIEQIVTKVFPLIYPNVVDFIGCKTETPIKRLIRHIKFMAGFYPSKSNRPKTGLKFEITGSIKNMAPDTFIRAIKTWQGEKESPGKKIASGI